MASFQSTLIRRDNHKPAQLEMDLSKTATAPSPAFSDSSDELAKLKIADTIMDHLSCSGGRGTHKPSADPVAMAVMPANASSLSPTLAACGEASQVRWKSSILEILYAALENICSKFANILSKISFKAFKNTAEEDHEDMKEQDELNEQEQHEEQDNDNKQNGDVSNDGNEGSGDGDEERDEFDRRQHKSIEAIPNERFEFLIRSTFEKPNRLKRLEETSFARVLNRTKGSYNHVATVGFIQQGMEEVEEYIVKVPAHGIRSSWTEEDEHTMLREIRIIEYIRRETSIPVPEIVGWEIDCFGVLQAPYIIMKKLPGETAYDIWNGDSAPEVPGWMNADVPSEATYQKRVRFLHSLAGYMAELEKLTFDKIGSVAFPRRRGGKLKTPTVEHNFHWYNHSYFYKMTRSEPVDGTTEYFMRLRSRWPEPMYEQGDEKPSEENARYRGMLKVFDMMLSHPVFNTTAFETFAIRHPDLDLQNILTDEDGNVTGILDWDGSKTSPRCIGPASTPTFLRRDWADFEDCFKRGACMSWSLDEWRQIYADAMKKTGCADAEYTLRSGIYTGVALALTGSSCPLSFTKAVIAHLPGFHMADEGLDKIVCLLGRGWPAAEARLQREITKLLDPEVLDTPKFEWDQIIDTSTPPTLECCSSDYESVDGSSTSACTLTPPGSPLTNESEDDVSGNDVSNGDSSDDIAGNDSNNLLSKTSGSIVSCKVGVSVSPTS